MGILNIPTENQKIQAGTLALMDYQNKMIEWYKNNYKLKYQDLLDIVETENIDFLSRVGDAVIQANLGQRRLKEAMERVVEKTPVNPLKIPRTVDFINGITDELSSFDFSLLGDAVLDLGKAVIKPVQSVAKSVGDTVTGATDTLSFVSKNLKWIILAVVSVVAIVGFGVLKRKADDL